MGVDQPFNHGMFQPPRFHCVNFDLNQEYGWFTSGQSLRVDGVQPNTQAQAQGVQPGWTICSVNGQGVDNLQMFMGLVQQVSAWGGVPPRLPPASYAGFLLLHIAPFVSPARVWTVDSRVAVNFRRLLRSPAVSQCLRPV